MLGTKLSVTREEGELSCRLQHKGYLARKRSPHRGAFRLTDRQLEQDEQQGHWDTRWWYCLEWFRGREKGRGTKLTRWGNNSMVYLAEYAFRSEQECFGTIGTIPIGSSQTCLVGFRVAIIEPVQRPRRLSDCRRLLKYGALPSLLHL